MLRSKKGQSTVEYLILVAGVIAVVVVFVGKNGIFQTALNKTYNTATTGMEGMAARLGASHCNASGGNCI